MEIRDRVKCHSMFIRADLLLKDDEGSTGGRHVIHYGWEDFEPVLLVYDQMERSVERVDLNDLDWTLSEGKWCVGSFEDDGYRRCPDARRVTTFDQCQACASSWIPVQSCIFEPQCDGHRCESRICEREHTVYVAFFGNMAKIGMTTSRRLRERGIEQGADAIAPLVRRENRLEGRMAEKDISTRLRLPQTMQRRKVLEAQGCTIGADGLGERYRSYLETLSSRMEVLDAPLELLQDYPVGNLDGRTPQLAETPGRHRGRIVGLKGKFLFYEDHSSKVKALVLADVPGRSLMRPGKRY
jgi:hypothetical protein